MEEDIKNLEELKREYVANGSVSISILCGAKYINSINNILSRLKQLEEENKSYNKAYNLGKTFANKQWEQKVKEKIEELEKEDLEIYDTDSEDVKIAKYEQRAVLDICEELLGGY